MRVRLGGGLAVSIALCGCVDSLQTTGGEEDGGEGVGAFRAANFGPPLDAPVDRPADVATGGQVDAATCRLPEQPALSGFALYARYAAQVDVGATVLGGDVGVEVRGESSLSAHGYALVTFSDARIDARKTAYARSIWMKGGTLGPLRTNKLVVNGGTHGDVAPFPAMPPMPVAAPVQPGTGELVVRPGAPVTLAGTAYQKIRVEGRATLRLSGGLYQLGTLQLDPYARVEVLAPVDLRIRDLLDIGQGGVLIPAPGTTLTAKDLLIQVLAGDQARAVYLRLSSRVRARLIAPDARVLVGAYAQLTGALAGSLVVLDVHSRLTFEDGLPELPPCGTPCDPAAIDDGNACTRDSCDATGKVVHEPLACTQEARACQVGPRCDPVRGPCVFDPVPDGTGCSDGDACNGLETCQTGTCTPGTPPPPPTASGPCAEALCDPVRGWELRPLPAGASCADGNVCNGGEICDGSGTCIPWCPACPDVAPFWDPGSQTCEPCPADAPDWSIATGRCEKTTLREDFALDSCGREQTLLRQFRVVAGNVHVLGADCGVLDHPGHGRVIDLDGSLAHSTTETLTTFEPGTYDLQLDLAGHTFRPARVVIDFGPLHRTVDVPANAGFSTLAIPDVTLTESAVLRLTVPVSGPPGGPPALAGPTLDDVRIVRHRLSCHAGDVCVEPGICALPPPTLDDGNPCTADSCDPVGGVAHTPVVAGTSCKDGSPCNGDETCDGAGHCLMVVPPTGGPAAGTLRHTPWQMHHGEGLVPFGFTSNGHGDVSVYQFATIPPAADAGWGSAPDSDIVNFDGGLSTLCGVMGCRSGGEFTYFQTFVNVPAGTEVTAFTITFDGVDDGARTTIFNSAYPNGAVVPGSYVHLGGNGTANLASLVRSGEINRVVVTHVDDCCLRTYLWVVRVALNGTSVSTGEVAPWLDDGNPCTADSCDPTTGVSHTPLPVETPCLDGNACNGEERCAHGAICAPGAPPDLSDGNPCTADACDPVSGVSHTPVSDGSSCGDGDLCNGVETCQKGLCTPGAAPPVNDGNPCTADSCHPSDGVRHTPLANGTSCADSDLCNGHESCQMGQCLRGSPPSLDDDNQCTVDICDPTEGVKHLPAFAGTACGPGCPAGFSLTAVPDLAAGRTAFAALGTTSTELDWSTLFPPGAHQPGVLPPHQGGFSRSLTSDTGATNTVTGRLNLQNWADGPGFDGPGGEAAADLAVDAVEDFEVTFGQPQRTIGFAVLTGGGNRPSEFDLLGARFLLSLWDAGGASVGSAEFALAPGPRQEAWVTVRSAAPFVRLSVQERGTRGQQDQYFGNILSVSCSPGNACTTRQRCDGDGTCRIETPPPIDDGDPCTTDHCDPTDGVRHLPILECPLRPDLMVTAIGVQGLSVDRQLRTVSGQVLVHLANTGGWRASPPYQIKLFEDLNLDGDFDPGSDAVLGAGVVVDTVEPGGTATLAIQASGPMTFAGAPVSAFVDSENAIAELNESNNVGCSCVGCQYVPPVGQFDPVLERSWTGSDVLPDYRNVPGTPVVIDLDGDKVPEIVFGTTNRIDGADIAPGYLRAIDGRTGVEKLVFTARRINASGSPAAGDIDGDGRPEILIADEVGTRLVAFEHDGTLKWVSPLLELISTGGAALADLDSDGTPEIVVGRQALRADGSLLWTGTGGRGSFPATSGALSIVADIDLDGSPDVVAGNTAYSATGAVKWQAGVGDGYVAAGNFDADPQAEIALVSNGAVWLLEHDGTRKWGPVSLPGGQYGGPPTIADVDGDGAPEVAVAGLQNYVVLETNGTVKWSAPTRDKSSGQTGSSVFDFDGDGSAEVVYADELRLRIYRGVDGHVLFETPMGSCTWLEYPLVADVDADGNAEVVSVANTNCGFSTKHGLFVFGDRNDTWVSTRALWNQHSYHVTNVRDDGSIPAREPVSWVTHNTYRLNRQPDGLSPHAAPDLIPSFARVEPAPQGHRITVRVGNGGAVAVGSQVGVAIYDGAPGPGKTAVANLATTKPLAPGEFEDLSFVLPSNSICSLWVSVDDDGTGRGRENECDEINNRWHPDLVLPLDPARPRPEDDGNVCTVDACDPAAGVSHTPVMAGSACSDGSLCNGDEACDGVGVCRSKPPALQSSCPSRSVTIDFDDFVVDTTAPLPTDRYRDKGVLFCQAAAVRDAWGGMGATSLPTALAVPSSTSGQSLSFRFVDPASGAPAVASSVRALVGDRSGEAETIVLVAYGLDGQELGRSSFRSLSSGHFGEVAVSNPGIHRVQVYDEDASWASLDDLSFSWHPPSCVNAPPQVDAGPDRAISIPPGSLTLAGTASDDGLPLGSTLLLTWSRVGGPGAVAFANAAALTTTATFTTPGTYVLRLSATDGALGASDDVTIEVLASPPPPSAPLIGVLDGRHIVQVDSATGQTTPLVTLQDPPHLSQIAFHQASGFLYSTTGDDGRLSRINPCTGQVTSLGIPTWSGGQVFLFEGLGYNGTDGKLYIAGSVDGAPPVDQHGETIFTVDPQTLELTRIGRVTGTLQGNGDVDLLRWANGSWFIEDSTAPPPNGILELYRVGTALGAVERVGRFATHPSGSTMMAYDPASARFFQTNGGQLNVVNLTTMAMTPLGPVQSTTRYQIDLGTVTCDGNPGNRAPLAVDDQYEARGRTFDLPRGISARLVAGSFDLACSMVVSDDERLYVSELGAPTGSGRAAIKVVNLRDLTTSTLKSGLPLGYPCQMVIGDGRPLLGRDLIIADWNSQEHDTCCDGRVFALDRNGSGIRVLARANPAFSPPGDPFGLALGPGGAFGSGLYVMDGNGASPHPPVLFRIEPDGASQTFVVDAVQWHTSRSPGVLAFGPSAYGGDLFVVDHLGVDGAVWRVKPDRSVSRFIGATSPGDLRLSPGGMLGSDMVLGEGSRIVRVSPDGSKQTWATLPWPSVGLALRPDGRSLFVNSGTKIYELFPLDEPPPASVLANDSDLDGDALTARLVSGPINGTVTLGADGTFAYLPAIGFSGVDSFTYVANDGALDSNVATVQITVRPFNEAPRVHAGDDRTAQLPVPVALNGSVSDDGLPLGGNLSITWTKESGPGDVAFASAGSPSTTASFSAPGTYHLRLQASDGELTSSDLVTVAVEFAGLLLDFEDGAPPSQKGWRYVSPCASLAGTPPGSINLTEAQAVTMANGRMRLDTSMRGTVGVAAYYDRLEPIDPSASFDFEARFRVTQVDPAPPQTDQAFSLNVVAGGFLFLSQIGDGNVRWNDVGGGTGASRDLESLVWLDSSQVHTYRFRRFGPSNLSTLYVDDVPLFTTVGQPIVHPPQIVFGDGTCQSRNGAVEVDWIRFHESTPAGPYLNQIPVVAAGADRTATVGVPIELTGAASDDGRPAGAPLTVFWSEIDGPGDVTFGAGSSAHTSATFSQPGTYLVRLTAHDSELVGWDHATVTVTVANQPPVVNAGPDRTILLPPGQTTVMATVSDDGLPAGGSVSCSWSLFAGPATPTFASPGACSTAVTFPSTGSYVLRVAASDGTLSAADNVLVIVEAAPPPMNLPPTVNAGPDLVLQMPGPGLGIPVTATLVGSYQDDGLPLGGPVTVQWGLAAPPPGPVGAVDFETLILDASFSVPGTYELALQVNDGALDGFDVVTVEVLPPENRAPIVSAGPDRTIVLSFGGGPVVIALQGSVSDDGLPQGGTLVSSWFQADGPAPVGFADVGSPTTSATFSVAGTYALRLEADDGPLDGADLVTITVTPAPVNTRPVVDAGPDREVILPATLQLTGTATDDGVPGPLAVGWEAVSGPGPVTFTPSSGATTTPTFVVPGRYILRLTASDGLLTASDDLEVLVWSSTTGSPPHVEIASPADDAVITELERVMGTASDTDLFEWTLAHRLRGTTEWTTIHRSSAPVTGGTLGDFDPTMLENGVHELRLEATDLARQTSSVTIAVTVEGNQKVGNFTVSFKDLSVPVAGIPIEVIRTYDSRKRYRSDFGVAWSLDIKTVRLQPNRIPGDLWQGTVTCADRFCFVLNYCISETKPHYITATFADGKVFRFRMAISPACQAAPPSTVDVRFEPLPGTTASLGLVAGNSVLVDGSFEEGTITDIDLRDQDDGSLFDPSRYLLTLHDGRQLKLSQVGGLEEVRDTNGNVLEVKPAGLFHSSGKSVKFDRDGQGRITRITDPMNGVLDYGYDARGDLSSFTDRPHEDNTRAVSTYGYDHRHLLTGIKDPRGVEPIRNEYDPDSGRLLRHVDPTGKKIEYTHDIANRREVVRDRLGNQTTHEYDDRGNVRRTTDALGKTSTFEYDDRDNKTRECNPLGECSRFEYDAADNKVADCDPIAADDPTKKCTRYTHDDRGNVRTAKDPLERVTEHKYDSRGNLEETRDALGGVTTYKYNNAGQQIEMLDAAGGKTTYGYDSAGNLESETDPLGNETRYGHDANGNRVSQTATRTGATGQRETLVTSFKYDGTGRLVRTTHPDGSTTKTTYNAIGQPAVATDGLGRETKREYDDRGRMVRTTHPDGTTEETEYDDEGRRTGARDRAGRRTRFVHDPVGRLTETVFPGEEGDEPTTKTSYDDAGRTASTTDEEGHTTGYKYDRAGRRTGVVDPRGKETRFTYDDAGNQASMTDPLGHKTTYLHDELNRRTEVVFHDETRERTEYDPLGRRKAKVDQAGVRTEYGHDKLGRLTSVKDPDGHTTRYGYDETGNQVSQTDARNRTTRFAYDLMGRRVRRTLPPVGTASEGASEQMTYDLAGQLASKKDFQGRTTTFHHDQAGRMVRKVYPDTSEVSFTHTPTGRRKTATDARGVTTYEYDDRDRLTRHAYPDGRKLEYQYDNRGHRKEIKATVGATTLVTKYEHDEAGRLKTVEDSSGGLYQYEHDDAGRRVALEHPNQVGTLYVYDPLNRLKELRTTREDGTRIQSYKYTLGATGVRTKVEEEGGVVREYEYDKQYRLTGEKVTGLAGASYTKTFSYDEVGNRKRQVTTGAGAAEVDYTYDERDRLLTEGDAEYKWDESGNLASKTGADGAKYDWDFDDRLVKVTTAVGTVVEHKYDADGVRVRTTTKLAGATTGKVTEYLVDTSGALSHVVVETDGAGGVEASYVRGAEDLLSRVTHASGERYYHVDGLGSVRTLTDASASVTAGYDYAAYGEEVASSGAEPQPYRFAGEPWEEHTKQRYHRARWYSSEVGRFTSQDSHPGIQHQPATTHQYVYALNDPANSVDPSGMLISELVDTLVNHFRIAYTLRLPKTKAKGIASLEALAKARAMLAIEEARPLVAVAATLVTEGHPFVRQIFGSLSQAGRSRVRDVYQRIGNELHNPDAMVIHYNPLLAGQNVLAMVLAVGAQRNIWIGHRFLELTSKAELEGGNLFPSRAGAVVHELSHLVAGTGDCTRSFERAIANANSPTASCRPWDDAYAYGYFVDLLTTLE